MCITCQVRNLVHQVVHHTFLSVKCHPPHSKLDFASSRGRCTLNTRHVVKRTNNFYLHRCFAILQETVVCGLNMYSEDPCEEILLFSLWLNKPVVGICLYDGIIPLTFLTNAMTNYEQKCFDILK